MYVTFLLFVFDQVQEEAQIEAGEETPGAAADAARQRSELRQGARLAQPVL